MLSLVMYAGMEVSTSTLQKKHISATASYVNFSAMIAVFMTTGHCDISNEDIRHLIFDCDNAKRV